MRENSVRRDTEVGDNLRIQVKERDELIAKMKLKKKALKKQLEDLGNKLNQSS